MQWISAVDRLNLYVPVGQLGLERCHAAGIQLGRPAHVTFVPLLELNVTVPVGVGKEAGLPSVVQDPATRITCGFASVVAGLAETGDGRDGAHHQLSRALPLLPACSCPRRKPRYRVGACRQRGSVIVAFRSRPGFAAPMVCRWR